MDSENNSNSNSSNSQQQQRQVELVVERKTRRRRCRRYLVSRRRRLASGQQHQQQESSGATQPTTTTTMSQLAGLQQSETTVQENSTSSSTTTNSSLECNPTQMTTTQQTTRETETLTQPQTETPADCSKEQKLDAECIETQQGAESSPAVPLQEVVVVPNPIATTSPSLIATTSTPSAVRALFRDQQQVISSSGTIRQPTQSAAIVNANRRLIARQIEAIQMADSRRWNFDFRHCRPMNQSGHRYVHYDPTRPPNTSSSQTTQRNCRPLNDQNQSATNNPVAGPPTRWRLPSAGGQAADCKQHRSDTKQQDDG